MELLFVPLLKPLILHPPLWEGHFSHNSPSLLPNACRSQFLKPTVRVPLEVSCGLPGSWLAAGQRSSAQELSLLTLMAELCEDMCLERRPKDPGCFSEIDTSVYHLAVKTLRLPAGSCLWREGLSPWGLGPGRCTGALPNYPISQRTNTF